MSQSTQQNWKVLYLAAIFEKDKILVPQRISAAEKAIIAKGRELLQNHGTPEEKEEIDDALYILRAFRDARRYLEGPALPQSSKTPLHPRQESHYEATATSRENERDH